MHAFSVKRFLKLLAALLVGCLLLCFGALADSSPQSSSLYDEAGENYVAMGTCGTSARWVFYEDGTLVISGQGEIRDLTDEQRGNGEWLWPENVRSNIRKVRILDGITKIGNAAFEEVASLREVELPDTLLEIGFKAFYRCTSLTSVDLPEGLEVLAGFEESGLQEVTVPSTVSFLSEFTWCPNLRKVTIKAYSGYSYVIANGAFAGCPNLEQIEVENGHMALYSRDGVLFSGSTMITYPQGKRDETYTIPEDCMDTKDAFSFMDGPAYLKEIIIPQSWSVIPIQSFWRCTSLSKVMIPEGISEIGPEAFAMTGLRSITIPGSVTKIGSNVFLNCNVRAVFFNGSEEEWNAVDRVHSPNPHFFAAELHFLKDSAQNCTKHIPEEFLAAEATCDNEGVLVKRCAVCGLFLPNESILPALGHDWGETTYTWNKSLAWSEWDVTAERVCKRNSEHIQRETANMSAGYTYSDCLSEGEVTYVGSFENEAFEEQEKIMPIPPIGHSRGTAGTVKLAGNGQNGFIGDIVCKRCGEVSSEVCTIDFGKILVLPSEVTTIEEEAFKGLTGIQQVILSENTISIGARAFAGCEELLAVYIPDTVTSISEDAFIGCDKVAFVTRNSIAVTYAEVRDFAVCQNWK